GRHRPARRPRRAPHRAPRRGDALPAALREREDRRRDAEGPGRALAAPPADRVARGAAEEHEGPCRLLDHLARRHLDGRTDGRYRQVGPVADVRRGDRRSDGLLPLRRRLRDLAARLLLDPAARAPRGDPRDARPAGASGLTSKPLLLWHAAPAITKVAGAARARHRAMTIDRQRIDATQGEKVTGTFFERAIAEKAVGKLHEAGFNDDQITMTTLGGRTAEDGTFQRGR